MSVRSLSEPKASLFALNGAFVLRHLIPLTCFEPDREHFHDTSKKITLFGHAFFFYTSCICISNPPQMHFYKN